jgi:3-deoxy-D-manno-octulosonate 8-phosphate phosphatase (KDO 8-P phosphatase)
MKHNQKLRNIKMLIVDIDGCLTDGTIWLDSNLKWRRSFNVLDGVGIKLLMDAGYQVGCITGGNSEDVRMRMEFLGIKLFFDGASDKVPHFKKILEETRLKPSEIAYIGDEIYDVPIMEVVGFSACPPRAVKQAKSAADHVTKAEGGYGSVREVCDLILENGAHKKKKPKARS